MACHSEERSDEESRFRQTAFCYANNEILRLRYASAQNDNSLLSLDQQAEITLKTFGKEH